MSRAKAPNAAALEAWLKKVDRGRAPTLVQLALSLADAVDRDSSESCPTCKRSGANAALWREYRTVLGDLTAALEVADDDGQASLLRLVSAPMTKPSPVKKSPESSKPAQKPRTSRRRSGDSRQAS